MASCRSHRGEKSRRGRGSSGVIGARSRSSSRGWRVVGAKGQWGWVIGVEELLECDQWVVMLGGKSRFGGFVMLW